MPFGIELAENVANSAVNAGMGIVLGGINDKRQAAQQQRLQDMQIRGAKEMTDYNRQSAQQMWDYTNYENQLKHMKAAGLNPGLMYGMGGGGGTTASTAPGSVSGATAQQNPGEVQNMLQYGIQLKMQEAQVKLAEAQARNLDADTENKGEGGATRENIKADTAVKLADQIIKEYTGKEAKSEYENVKEPNRQTEANAYGNQLNAAYATANVVYNLMIEGKLYEKGLAEIEALTLQNSKTREETKNIQKQFDILEQNLKGAKLDNIIKDLETRLQTQTGIDKNSPAWMKILGRLFVQLFNQ